ncbi:MAG TPA: DUF2905 domain-containing protein [Pseudogracilibacillus sp.]|nr:DUF2905 domain-containing protein [Pseudogracilibacillus sp.]
MQTGKMLMIAGIVLFVLGALWTWIGKLPGDFSFKKGNISFHFPFMTSIIVSIILTLLLFLISKLNR